MDNSIVSNASNEQNIVNSRMVTEDEIQQQCSICFEPFKLNERVKQMSCNHIFHNECLKQWFTHQLRCPLCRTDVVMDTDNETSIDSTMEDYESVGYEEEVVEPASPLPIVHEESEMHINFIDAEYLRDGQNEFQQTYSNILEYPFNVANIQMPRSARGRRRLAELFENLSSPDLRNISIYVDCSRPVTRRFLRNVRRIVQLVRSRLNRSLRNRRMQRRP